jgi:hypothetical protein
MGMNKSVTDVTTGKVLSPQDQFHRYVADPAHRDANGDLHIRFATYVADPSQAFFSPALCADRIQTIGVNLVGDVGVQSAGVDLVYGGTSYVRSCDPKNNGTPAPYTMPSSDPSSTPNETFINASVNAAMGNVTDPTALHPFANNGQFMDRALLASPLELVIRQAENFLTPVNVLGLDDIQIVIIHSARKRPF